MKNAKEIERLKNYDTEVAKDKLLNITSRLEDIGAIREAKSLYAIIGKLEAWQHK